jgi:hypothetical protein
VDKFTGGGSDDSFAATGATLGSLDVIAGGAGTDTLTVKDTTKASAAGFAGSVAGVETLDLSSNGGMGAIEVAAVAAGISTTAVAQKATIVYSGKYVTDDTIIVKVGSTRHEVTVGDTSKSTTDGQDEAATAVEALLSSLAADSLTVSDTATGSKWASGGTHVTPLVSKVAGTPIGVSVENGTLTSTSTGAIAIATAAADQGVTTGVTTATASVVATGGTAIAEVARITVGTATDPATVNVSIDGTTYTAASSGASATTVGNDIATIINSVLGAKTASADTGVVTITAPVAGTPLPLLDVTVLKSAGTVAATDTFARLIPNKAANSAGSAKVDAVVYNASGFDTVKASAEGDINTKLAATATATLATTAGSATVSGGANVTVTATKAVTLYGSKITEVTATTGTTSAAVNIGSTDSATTAKTTPALTTASVTGGSDVLVADYSLGESTGTLTSVTIAGTKDSSVSLYGEALTNLTVGTQKTATTITVNNTATTAHTLDVTLGKAGLYISSAAAAVTIKDNTAETMNLDFTAANASVVLSGDATLTSVTATGAGGGKLDLGTGNGITSFSAAQNSGGLTIAQIPAAVTTITTGSGADVFTTTATKALTVDAGDGADVVTIGANVAVGSSVSLGAGDDRFMKSSTYVVSTDSAALPTTIDGGSGNDIIDTKLITAGNGDQFINFEYLGLNGSSSDAALLTGSTISALVMLNGGGTFSGIKPTQSLTVIGDASSDTTTLSYGTSALGTDDALSITLADPNANFGTTKPTSANFSGGAVVASGVEDYTINSAGTLAWNALELGANTSAETVTITGSVNLDLTFASGFGNTTSPKLGVSSISGAGATGKLAINATNVVHALTGLTITGGSGDDTITTTGITTVAGGAGKDIVDVTDNILSVSDTATAAEVVAELITITDFAYGDKIHFNTGIDAKVLASASGVSAEIDVTAATTFLEAVNIAAAGGTNDAGDTEINWFVYGADTYILYDENTATSTDVDDGDVVVKIVGTHDFTNSTLTAAGVFDYVA